MTTQRIQISSQIKKSIQDPDKKDTQVDETVNNLEEILKNTKVSAEKKKDTLRNNQTEMLEIK